MTKREFGGFLARDCNRKGISLTMVARNTDIPLWKLEDASQNRYVLSYKEIKRIVRFMHYSPTQPPFSERSEKKVCEICGSTKHLNGCPCFEPFYAHRCSLCGGGIEEGEPYLRIPGEELGRNREDLFICQDCAEKYRKFE